ncbi:histamine H1 receptor-like [Mercenaria mercenaria]|uniref:histamine H1 receptor-like n=1 Tax=Mercenaria mercenaria TaxID=6596 RepID=UPI00234F2F61|nr:histamine H1 receptor-like [Mercenaria mercenaria]
MTSGSSVDDIYPNSTSIYLTNTDFDFDILFNLTNTSSSPVQRSGRDLWREIPLGIVLTFLCLLTTVGNAMVLHAVRTERRLQSVSNMFIVSLAIADLIVGLFVMPTSTVYIFTEDWRFGVAVCQIWIGIDYTASTASILNLFILSLDRYWSVTSPLKYIRKRTKKRAVLMITGAWLLSSLWIIPIAGWHHFFHGGTRTVPPDVCDTEYAKNSALKVITAFFNFFLPLAVMYALYFKIFQEIRKRSELELGQRNVKSLNSYVSTMTSCHDDISFSDQNLDTGSENNSVIDSLHVNNSTGVDVYQMTNLKPRRNCKSHFVTRLLKSNKKRDKSKKGHREIPENETDTNSKKCKVEYVYDENVIDQETEKVERYFYEEYTSSKPAQKPNHILVRNSSNISGDLSVSSPSTPISSCSSTEDKRIRAKEKYSLMSGLRRIREAETIIDTTVSASCKKNNTRNAFVFRDERSSRRQSNMFNIKNRIRNIRQSSALTKEIKAARQLGVIMGAFTLCFLPYFILFLVVAFCDGCIDQGLLLAMTWVGYLNSTLNPFLYPLCNANFRRKFRIMLGLKAKRARYRNRDCYDRNSLTTARYD